jgi:hypothetical protein
MITITITNDYEGDSSRSVCRNRAASRPIWNACAFISRSFSGRLARTASSQFGSGRYRNALSAPMRATFRLRRFDRLLSTIHSGGISRPSARDRSAALAHAVKLALLHVAPGAERRVGENVRRRNDALSAEAGDDDVGDFGCFHG